VRGCDIVGVEQPLRAELADGERIAGFADLVLRRGRDRVEIWDHKVTRYARSPAQLRTDLQLNLYGWLALRQWPWATRVIAGHHYPPLGRRVSVVLSTASMQAAADRVLRVGAEARADTQLAPTWGEHCGHCCWSDLCEEGTAWLTGGFPTSQLPVTVTA
jgi:RecB family exonuclease